MGGLVDTVKENPMLLAIPAAAVAGPALFPALAGGAGAAGAAAGTGAGVGLGLPPFAGQVAGGTLAGKVGLGAGLNTAFSNTAGAGSTTPLHLLKGWGSGTIPSPASLYPSIAQSSITQGLNPGSLAPVTPGNVLSVAEGVSPASGIGGWEGLMQLTRSPMGRKLLSPEGLQQAQNLFGGEEDQQALPPVVTTPLGIDVPLPEGTLLAAAAGREFPTPPPLVRYADLLGESAPPPPMAFTAPPPWSPTPFGVPF